MCSYAALAAEYIFLTVSHIDILNYFKTWRGELMPGSSSIIVQVTSPEYRDVARSFASRIFSQLYVCVDRCSPPSLSIVCVCLSY